MKEFPDRPDKRARWTSGLEPAGKKKPKMKVGKSLLFGAMGLAAVAAVAPKSVEGTSEKDTTVASSTMNPLDSAGLRGKIFTDFDEAVAAAQKRLRSPDVVAALKGDGYDSLARIFPALSLGLDAPYYDVSELGNRYPVQIVRNSRGGLSILPATLDSSRASFADPSWKAGYGNGLYWDNAHTILTADHVFANMVEGLNIKVPRKNPDVALISVPDRFAATDAAQVIHDDPQLTDADIEGAPVTILGIDPDETSNPETGRKAYTMSLAARVSPGMAHILANGNTQWERLFVESFMVAIPHDEAKEFSVGEDGKLVAEVSGASTTGEKADSSGKIRKVTPGAGESGSGVFCRLAEAPVFMHRDGKQVFCGIFWGSKFSVDERTGKQVDIGFFFGIDEIREGISKEAPYVIK